MNRFEIIEALEGRLVRVPSGKLRKVENGQYVTCYGVAKLILHEIGYLEVLLRHSVEPTEQSYESR